MIKTGVQALIKKIQIIAFIIAGIIVVVVVYTSISKEEIPESEKIIFTPPVELLDAREGVPYEYSFCRPDSARSGATCGGLAGATTDPYGGNPPYSFSHQFGVGFIPTGMALELNGLLRGTPTVPGEYTFGVCVTDLYEEVCKTTSLIVKPKSEEPEEEVTSSVKITSASATPLQYHEDGGVCRTHIKIAGTATLPEGYSLFAAICEGDCPMPATCTVRESCKLPDSGLWTCTDLARHPWYPSWCSGVRKPGQPATGEWTVDMKDPQHVFGHATGKPEKWVFIVKEKKYENPVAWDSVTLTPCP